LVCRAAKPPVTGTAHRTSPTGHHHLRFLVCGEWINHCRPRFPLVTQGAQRLRRAYVRHRDVLVACPASRMGVVRASGRRGLWSVLTSTRRPTTAGGLNSRARGPPCVAVPATAGLRVRRWFSAGARPASSLGERNDGMTLALHSRSRHRHARPARSGPPSSSRAESEFSGAWLPQPAVPSSALPASAGVTVGVMDPAQRLSSLAAALPDAWRLAVLPVGLLVGPFADPALAGCDALLLGDADGGLVRMARTCLPRTPIVALLSVDAPAGRVVEVLRAGADACVRGTDPAAVLVAHLRACLRRGQVGR